MYFSSHLSQNQYLSSENFPDKVRESVSHNKPKKRAFASHDIALGHTHTHTAPPLTESQQISPNRAKNGVCVLIIWKNPDSFEIIRKIGYHLENPDSFEIIRKIGSHLENRNGFEIIQKIGNHSEESGQFWNNPEIGNHL